MPWKESRPMDERVRFISRLLDGERMHDLCQEFGISRKTGYKFRSRYLAQGVRGLVDESRAPRCHPHHTPRELEELVVTLRKTKPTWGPKKLKARLAVIHPGLAFPAASTIGDILRRYEIPLARRRRRRKAVSTGILRESTKPNDIWCVDFKGQFELGNRRLCYPLTISDHFSRYLLGCEALEGTRLRETISAFEQVFAERGLPKTIRSDNGTPFAGAGPMGWSQLAVWWLRLGIELERIEPGHPEQNGRHERMHWTLKNEATRPASRNHLQQQERFDVFREEFNEVRPHEALGMKTPASVYTVSEREYPEHLDGLEYPLHDITAAVASNGKVHVNKQLHFYLSNALAEENVGLREIEPGRWLVSFLDYDLGCFDEKNRTFTRIDPCPSAGL